MIFLTADAQAAIPIDVQLVPRSIAKYVFIGHVSQQSCQQGPYLLLLVLTEKYRTS